MCWYRVHLDTRARGLFYRLPSQLWSSFHRLLRWLLAWKFRWSNCTLWRDQLFRTIHLSLHKHCNRRLIAWCQLAESLFEWHREYDWSELSCADTVHACRLSRRNQWWGSDPNDQFCELYSCAEWCRYAWGGRLGFLDWRCGFRSSIWRLLEHRCDILQLRVDLHFVDCHRSGRRSRHRSLCDCSADEPTSYPFPCRSCKQQRDTGSRPSSRTIRLP